MYPWVFFSADSEGDGEGLATPGSSLSSHGTASEQSYFRDGRSLSEKLQPDMLAPKRIDEPGKSVCKALSCNAC